MFSKPVPSSESLEKDNSAQLRRLMVENQLKTRGIKDPRILEAFLKVPRHLFTPDNEISQAYEDHPLSIGLGQTISQPYMVAYMLDKLELTGEEKVLEIGTGSGYQTALLDQLVKQVYTVERLPELLNSAKEKLQRLGYKNIIYNVGDGSLGWPEFAPYDRIIVSAASPAIPDDYNKQLRDKGILVIPVGDKYVQELIQARKKGNDWQLQSYGSCVFVKLIGQ